MQPLRKFSHLLFAVALAATVAGCQSDSPTEPSGGGGPISAQPPAPVVGYTVTVTANPPQLSAGGSTPTNILVQVRRTDNGQAPANSTPVTLSTTLGEFGQIGSGLQTVQLQLVNGQAQAVLYPGTSAGTATVRAALDANNVAATNVQISQQDTFFVGFVEPGVGHPRGGEEVTIVGGGFDGPVRVTFNGAVAQVRSVSPNRIRVLTPTGTAAGVNIDPGETQPVTVSVTNNVNEANTATDSLSNGFTYTLSAGVDNQPVFFTISPSSGSNDGGTTAVITGDGFSSPLQVFFGTGGVGAFSGVEAVVQSVTPTRITLTTPPARGFGQDNANRNVSILIINRNGAATVAAQRFTYGTDVQITAVSGSGSGPYTGGTILTIQGNGFDEPVAVSLGGVGQTVLNTSGSQVTFRTSGIPVNECPENGTVPVEGLRLVNIETGDFGEFGLVFLYTVPRPAIFTVNNTGGGNATVTGQNFTPGSPGVQVIFGDPDSGSSAPVTGSNTSGNINIRVPSAPAGFTFNTEPCDGNGDGIAGGTRLAQTPISVSVRNLDGPGCVATQPNAFVLTPPNTTCTGDTSTPPPAPQCSDGVDNDGDGFTDYNVVPALRDPQCTSPSDTNEAA
jgi:hypothetical protein